MAIVVKRDKTTPLRKQPEYYSDFISTLDYAPGSADIYRLTNVDSVKNSIKNIVLTNKGERLFNPEFGCDVRSMLFENIDPSVEATIKTLIETAISNFEPRANLINVVVSGQPDLNAYIVSIVFTTINSPETQTLDLILTRVR